MITINLLPYQPLSISISISIFPSKLSTIKSYLPNRLQYTFPHFISIHLPLHNPFPQRLNLHSHSNNLHVSQLLTTFPANIIRILRSHPPYLFIILCILISKPINLRIQYMDLIRIVLILINLFVQL